MSKQTPIQEVVLAAARARAARRELEDAIAEARRRGESLRAIATAADMSHEQVRRIAG